MRARTKCGEINFILPLKKLDLQLFKYAVCNWVGIINDKYYENTQHQYSHTLRECITATREFLKFGPKNGQVLKKHHKLPKWNQIRIFENCKAE